MNNSIAQTTMHIPQFRPYIDIDTTTAEIRKVLESGMISESSVSEELKGELKKLIGAEHIFFAPNGTLALVLALQALGIGPGDEVLVPDITFIATANAVEMVGASPRPIDIVTSVDTTLDIDVAQINTNTRALLMAPLFGTAPTNLEAIIQFCEKNDLILIEDAAQCIGIRSSTNHMGTFGKIATFSFYADKTITMGEGGLVVTNDDKLADRLQLLRNQGRRNSGTFVHEAIGYNYRITDLQAALGLSQLRQLDTIHQRKTRILSRYRENLSDQEKITFLTLREDDFTVVPFRCVVFTPAADKLIGYMESQNVQSRAMFYPIHLQPGYEHYQWSKEAFPNSTLCSETGICLPTWVEMSDQQIDYVCEVLINGLKLNT